MTGAVQPRLRADPEAPAPAGGRAPFVRRHWFWIGLAALTGAAAFLRIWGMGQSPLGDELYTVDLVGRPDLVSVLHGVESPMETNPPLFYVLAWMTSRIGDPLVWMRLPSVVAGIALVPAVAVLGRRVAGRAAGLLAGALVTLSPFAIFYSNEARGYALATLLVTLSTVALLRAVRTGRVTWWLAVFALNVAALYVHYTAAFPLGAQLVWALCLHRHRWRATLLTFAAVAVGFVPWLPQFLDDRAPAQILGAIAAATPVGETLVRWLTGNPFIEPSRMPGSTALVLLAIAVVLLIAGTIAGALRGRWSPLREQASPGLVLIVALALITPAGLALYGALDTTLFAPRNLSLALPALAVLIGTLTVRLPRAAAVAVGGLLVVGLGIGAVKSLQTEYQRPDYAGAAAFIDREAAPGDPVLEVAPLYPPGPLQRHVTIHFKRPHPVFRSREPGQTEQAIQLARTRGRPLFVVAAEPDLHAIPARGLRLQREIATTGLAAIVVRVYSVPRR